MLEDFMNIMTDENLSTAEDEETTQKIKDLIEGLELFSNDPKMLTKTYTDIFCSDMVVYLMTRISQNPILYLHFPELYMQNANGESVINCQQNSKYHRHGVFRHTLYTMEYVGKDNLKYSKQDIKILKWTMFLHDIGKPFAKTTNNEGVDSFAGHDDISVEMAKEVLERFYFSPEEKKAILTLIKYHDRYLNEGELTYENLSFLAQELEDKKELFELLIEVKLADNKAKSVDVYNKFLTVVPKYVDFLNEHFKNIEPKEIKDEPDELTELIDDELIISAGNEKKEPVKVKRSKTKITQKEYDETYDNILNDSGVFYTYFPLVDVYEKNIFGYEIQLELNDYEMEQILKYAKEEGKFDKFNQLVFSSIVQMGSNQKNNKQEALIANVDFNSFKKYNNKNRIYDVTDKDNVIIGFSNYDNTNVIEINKVCKEIKRNHGSVMLKDFNHSKFDLHDLENLDIDYIQYDILKTDNQGLLEELISYCQSDTKKLIVKNINAKKSLDIVKKLDIGILQGNAIFKPLQQPELTEYEIEEFINKKYDK